MRKLFVAAAIGTALVGAGWLGTSLVAPYEPEATPPAAATNPTVNGRKTQARVRVKTWAEQASASCARALEDSRAVLRDAPFTTADSASGTQAVLRVMRTLGWIEARLLRELKRARPARADRRPVNEALSLLATAQRDHAATLAALQRSWNPGLLEEAARREMQASAKLRLLFLRTGATACVAFHDPESY